MGTFTTKLKLGGRAFCVRAGLDPYIEELTVGQIRVIETLPSVNRFISEPCYKEEYMCIETGVGCGSVWEYGRNIFATESEADAGVIAHQQAAYKQRAARDAADIERLERMRKEDLATLARLKLEYEAVSESESLAAQA